MNRTAIVMLVLLLAAAPAAVTAQTTGAARPADAQSIDVPRTAIAAGRAPWTGQLPEDLRELLGAREYPGAPTLADIPGFSRCEIDCSPCDWLENEPICGVDWIDSYNGGCNSNPDVFDTLLPYYGKITLCGMSGNYLYSGLGYRDTDWYEIHVDEPTYLRYCCTAEFPLLTFLIDGTGGCGAMSILETAYGDTCAETCIEYQVAPGTYWLWVGTQVFAGIPCDSEYKITLEGFAYQNCDPTCPGGGILENEPVCYPQYEDHWNGGCNSTPHVFQTLEPAEGVITVCGEAGVYPYMGGCYRDTDWYEIVLDQPREIQFCVWAEFPLSMFMLGGPCEQIQMIDSAYSPDCTQACLTHTFDPGIYWLWVGSAIWDPLDCGRRYIMTVENYTTAVERTTWGTLKSMYR